MRARLRWILLVVLVLVASAVLLARAREEAEAPPAPAGARLARTLPGSQSPPGATATPPIAAPSLASPLPPPAPGARTEPVVDPGYPVNLESVRAQIPGNRYWRDEAPTNDPEALRLRDADRAAWNVLHGKLLSGTASDAEIRTWFEHRRQVSDDAIEFAGLLLADHGSELPERDRGLLELAMDMHRTRLAELPREEAAARARKAEQDRRRDEWQRRSTP